MYFLQLGENFSTCFYKEKKSHEVKFLYLLSQKKFIPMFNILNVISILINLYIHINL